MKFDLIKQDSIKVPVSKVKTITLYRIIALEQFENPICGVIPKYAIGGYVESVNNLDDKDTSWIRGTAKVYGSSRIEGNSLIDWDATVGDSSIFKSWLTHRASVIQKSKLFHCKLSGNSQVIDASISRCTLGGSSLIQAVGGSLEIDDTHLTDLSFIKASGRISNTMLKEGAGIAGTNIEVDNCDLSGVAVLRESGHKLTLSRDPNLSVISES